MNWINMLGLIIVILILVPNMVYAYRNKNIKNECTSRLMNIVEQIGRYGSMLFMVFNIGIWHPREFCVNVFSKQTKDLLK